MIERLIRWLSYSRSPVLGRLFGLPPLLVGYDPAVHEAIIRNAERAVYGREGRGTYETRTSDELARLARRTLAQYRAQAALYGSWWILAARGLLFALALPLVVSVLIWRTLRNRSRRGRAPAAEVAVVVAAERVRAMAAAVFEGMPLYFHADRSMRFGVAEARFLARTIRACPAYLASPGLLLSVLRWLARYGYVTTAHRPHVMVNFFEGTAASSLLTAYLHERDILHVNLMHGEMFYSADCAFAEFDRFFVWGRHFEELFRRLGHDARRLAIAGSPDHRTLFREIREAEQPRGNSVLLVHNSVVTRLDSPDMPALRRLLRLLPSGWNVRVRSHPAANTTLAGYVAALQADPVVRENGLRIVPEPFEAISLPDALRRSRVVAGVYSTALLEGWVAGCKLVYLPGVIARDAVLPRHDGSPNVLYLDAAVSDASVLDFLSTPATLDTAEATRVDRLTQVLGPGERFATSRAMRSVEPLIV